MQPSRRATIKPRPVEVSPIKSILIVLCVILVSFLLASCSSFTREKIVIQNVPVYAKVLCPDARTSTPLSPRPIRPRAVKDFAGIYWVGLTPEDYENLAINTKDTIRYITDQKGVAQYYRKCIIDFNAEIDRLKAAPDDAD